MNAVLSVTGGRLEGSSARLSRLTGTTIGSAFDNDIVLRDTSIAARHMSLSVVLDTSRQRSGRSGDGGDVQPEIESIEVEAIDGEVRVGGRSIAPGERQRLDRSSFDVGELTLSCSLEPASAQNDGAAANGVDDRTVESSDPRDTDADNRIETSHTNINHADTDTHSDTDTELHADSHAGGGGITDTDSDTDTETHVAAALAHHRSASSASRRLVWALPLVLLVSLALLGWQLTTSTRSGEPVASLSAEQLLAGSDFDRVELNKADGQWIATGFVKTRQRGLDLKDLFEQGAEPVSDRTIVVEAMLDKVSDVFRVNGLDATARLGDAGEVVVSTATRDVDLLARLERMVKADVPTVDELVIDNTPVATPVESPGSEPSGSDPGKRVAMVVSDSPAHVVTEDESHYFVGALLPSGHRIESIEEGRVTVVKNGNTTELQF